MKDATSLLRGSLVLLPLTLAAVSGLAQPSNPPRPAVPLEPISAIADAFRSHSLVALGETHGHEQRQAFLLDLISDPRFEAVVNDIVVELGNSRYQDLSMANC